MARYLGEARVSVVPDAARFKPQAEAAVKKATAGLSGMVKLNVDPGLRAKLDALVKKDSAGLSADVKVKLDSKGFDAELLALKAKTDALSKSLGNLKLGGNAGPAGDFLKATLKQASELRTALDNVGDSQGITRATSQLDKMIASSDKIRTALSQTTFAEEEVGRAAAKAAQDAQAASSKIVASTNKVATAEDKLATAQSKAWATYGKNLLATEKLEAERARQANLAAAATNKVAVSANQAVTATDKAAEAQSKAWATYGKNLLATEKLEADRARAAKAADAAQTASINKAAAAAKQFSSEVRKIGINDNVKIRTSLDTTLADFQLANLRIKLDTLRTNAKVGLDTKGADAQAVGFREKLKALLGSVSVKVKAVKDNASFSSILSYIRGKFGSDAGKAAADAGDKAGKSFVTKLAESAAFQNPGITAAVVAGLAALPAAVGAVGVLSGIALGASIIGSAQKLITSQLQNNLTIGQKQLTVSTDQATIARLSNVKKPTPLQQQQLATAQQKLPLDQQALFQAQNASAGISQKQLLAYQASFNSLNNAIGRLKGSYLQFAVIASKPLLQPFINAADYLGKQLRGPLAVAFRDLFTAVAPLVKPVEIALLEIVKGILPGMTSLLNAARGPLSALFIGFGKIVGVKIGDWFRAATPYIKASSNYFLALVGALGNVVTWLIKFGGESAKAFGDPALKGFGPIIKAIANDILKLIVPAFQGWIEVIAPISKILGYILVPLLNFLANNPALVKGITEFAAAWYLAAKAIAIVNVALKLLWINPLGAPWVALAAAIIIAAVLIIKYWGPISRFFIKVWKDIYSGFITPFVNFFAKTIPTTFKNAVNWVQKNFIVPFTNFFTKTIPNAFNVTLNWLKKNWPLLLGIIGGPFGAAVGLVIKYHAQILNAIKAAWGRIENVITGVAKPIGSVIAGVWNQVYRITKSVWGVIVNVIKVPVLIILGLIGELTIGVRNAFNAVWPWLVNTTRTAWGHIENAITGAVKPIASIVTGAWHTIQAATAAAWNWIFNTSKTIWGHIENAITGIVKPLVSWIEGAWNTLKNATAAAWNWIYTATKTIWGHIENVITGIVKPMVSWIIGAWNTLKNATAAAWNWISTTSKNIWTGIKNIVIGIVKALWSAINGQWNSLKTITQNAFNIVHDYIVNPLTKAWNWIKNTFVSGVKSAFSGLVSGVKSIWAGLKGVVAGPVIAVDKIWNSFAGFVNKGLSIFGIHKGLPTNAPTNFARGGKVPGFAPGSDTVNARLSPGEYVLNPTAARAIGHRTLDRLNASARPGLSLRTHPAKFASGGSVTAGYVNPIPAGATPERIDQGVDFAGNGPIKAIGAGTILETSGAGWPGGPYMSYRLNNGALAGLDVYVAENIRPTVRAGQAVKAGETIANMFNGGTGIETGFAAPGGSIPLSQTAAAGSISGGNLPGNGATKVGILFDELLQALGAPRAPNYPAAGVAGGGGKLPGNLNNVGSGSGGNALLNLVKAIGSGALGVIGSVLTSLAQAALSGIEGLLTTGLSHIPGQGPFHDLPIEVVTEIINAAKGKLTGNQNNYTQVSGGTGPPGGATGSRLANAQQGYQYLLKNLFGGNKTAAAGAVASIDGESLWNPFAQGTGGRGLIGWTPPGTISNADFSGGMKTQLPAVLRFVTNSGDSGVIAQMFRATTINQAAQEWDHGVERAGINDVHPAGLALAKQVSGLANARGGMIPGRGAAHYASGGLVSASALAKDQSSEVGAFGTLSGATRALLAHPNSYAKSHKASLTSELATITKRQQAEAAAYKALSGKGFTKSNLSKFGSAAKSELTTSGDKILSTAEVKQTGALGSVLKAIIGESALSLPVSGGGNTGIPSAATLAKEQAAEKAAYNSLVAATRSALAHPTAFVKAHKATLTGELATLEKRQATEQAAYALLSGKGLTKSNFSKFVSGVKSELTTDKDQALTGAEAVLTAKMADTLDAILGVAGPAVPGTSGSTGSTKKIVVPRTNVIGLARNQAAENVSYDNLLAAAAAKNIPPGGNLGLLKTREKIEQASYFPLTGTNGLSKANLAKYTNNLKSVLSVAKNKSFSQSLPAETTALAKTLNMLLAVIAGGTATIGGKGVSVNALKKVSSSVNPVANLVSGLTSAQYGSDLKSVHGISLATIRKNPALSHIWHLLHLQHEADIGKKLAHGGPVFDNGGILKPGANLVYNHTGKPEHVVPKNKVSSQTVTLEFASGGGSEFDQFMMTMLRRYVRVKGGGNVQKAFGKQGA
jgi:phage-related protein